ncbi:hypothetical protein D9757_003477 [Collybiopsis confluens]|uniref:SET domain-containing protein n=1 Tax=Collybiopsis confluens TaxID=2823264 RepID=A0A8H5HTJ5_9AGAR|nr:hypothetical protein D9757_003477 [Collybiopsis confluens]
MFTRIGHSEGKGRAVFACRKIPRHTIVEISPVLLFGAEEYEKHGKYTILDHYTFKWKAGRFALALGIGSLFNHSNSPNISYFLDPQTDSIRYQTVRDIEQDEELCIFYGHNLWFDPIDPTISVQESDLQDGWGGLLSATQDFDPDEIVEEDFLPFTRFKSPVDDEEDLESIKTTPAWVVDIPEPRQITSLLKWLKTSGLDDPVLSHLKRVRKHKDQTTMLLSITPDPPEIPPELQLFHPYQIPVPSSAALTLTSLNLKITFWPTIYAPKRKGEVDPWTRGKLKWATDAAQVIIAEASKAQSEGELPISAYMPPSYNDDVLYQTALARDTRTSVSHPLRHAALNLVRKVADLDTQLPQGPTAVENGTNYLLTSRHFLYLSNEKNRWVRGHDQSSNAAGCKSSIRHLSQRDDGSSSALCFVPVMPVASSSARRKPNTRTRVQPDSDIEDGPSQRSAREEVDDDEDDEPRRVVAVAKEATKGKGRTSVVQKNQANDDNGDALDDDDDNDKIDIANFADQPLDRTNLLSMRGLAKDWETIKQVVGRGNSMVGDVAVALADAAEGDDGGKGLLELERLLQELIDVENEMQINQDAVERLSQDVASGEQIAGRLLKNQYPQLTFLANRTMPKNGIEPTFKRIRKVTRPKPQGKSMRRAKRIKTSSSLFMQEIKNPGQAMPPVTEFLPKENGDDSDDDEDLEIGAVTQDYKCPLTLRPLENPVTSNVCGHSFSRDALHEYFVNSRGSKDCPASGCSEKFSISDCKVNKELARKLKLHERRLKKREEEMEVDEVVE